MEHQTTALFPILPLELVTEILLKLSVKALLRFRVVSSGWRNVIDSNNFLNIHLSRSIRNEMNHSIVLEDSSESSLFCIHLKSLEHVVELNVRSWWPEDLWYEYCGVRLWGSCNGLLCLASFWRDIALWNPSTKKHLFLPPLSLDEEISDYDSSVRVALGFGFDDNANDYKIVSIAEQYDFETTYVSTEVKIYSLRSNSWQRVHGFPKGHNHQGTIGILVRQSFHWLVTRENEGSSTHYLILAYDLKTDEFYTLTIPGDRDGWISHDCLVSIQVIEGCLSVSFFTADVGLDFWILKEYGVEKSWTKLISIYDLNVVECYLLQPIFYNKNFGILIIVKSREDPLEIVWHNFESKSTIKVPVHGLPESYCGAELLMESLVRLDIADP